MDVKGSLNSLSDDSLNQVAGGMTAEQEEEMHGMVAHLKHMGVRSKESAKGYFMFSDEQLLKEYYDYIDANWDSL